MADERRHTLTITIDSKKIVYQWSVNNANPDEYPEDIPETNIRIELQIAKIFHKILNLLKTDKDLFQREDYELLGQMLYKILFASNAGKLLIEKTILREIEDAKGKAKCRIYLEFDKNSDMAILPWEYTILKDSSGKSIYIAANKESKFDLIRRIGGDKDITINSPKLYLLVIIANKNNAEEEIAGISSKDLKSVLEGLKKRHPDRFEYRLIENTEAEDLRDTLLEKLNEFEKIDGEIPPYAIHYLGHSKLKNNTGYIVLSKKGKGPVWVEDSEFAKYFDPVYLGTASPALFVLQSCDSAKVGNYAESKGVALSLTKKGIAAVVGMQNEVDEPTSSAFLDVFYEELLKGKDVAEAVTSGRDFLGKVYNVAGPEIYKSNSFGSPVLFITTREPIQMLSNKPEVINDEEEKENQNVAKAFDKVCSKCFYEYYETTLDVCKRPGCFGKLIPLNKAAQKEDAKASSGSNQSGQ